MRVKQLLCIGLVLGSFLFLGCIGQAEVKTVTLPPETVLVTETLPAQTITVGGQTVTLPPEIVTQQKTLPPSTIEITITRVATLTEEKIEKIVITETVQGKVITKTTTKTRYLTTTYTQGCGNGWIWDPEKQECVLDMEFSLTGGGSSNLLILGLVVLILLLWYRRRRR